MQAKSHVRWKFCGDHATNPPYALGGGTLAIFGDILEEIANSDSERNDLLLKFLKIYKNYNEKYDEKTYNKLETFALAESYIPLDFEGRKKIDASYYELDYEKVKKNASITLAALEKLAI